MSGTMRAVGIDTFSTATLPLHRRLSYWNALARKTYTPVIAGPLDGDDFDAALSRVVLGEISIGQVTSTPSVVYHTRQHAARTRRRSLFLQLQLTGESVHRQDGRQVHLRAGDFTLLDSARPYTSRFLCRHDVLVVGLPEHLARRIVGRPEAVTCLAMRGKHGATGVLGAYLAALWTECRHTVPKRSVPHFTAALLHLIQGALVAIPQALSATCERCASKYSRAIDYIEARLGDPGLSAASIAVACNVSPRHLHRLFARHDEAVSEYILRRRLEECASILQSPLQRGRTLGSVAADYGFQTLTGFGRAFRKRYGVTPSEHRLRCSAGNVSG